MPIFILSRLLTSVAIDMQRFKCHNGNTRYILSVIDIFSKYAWPFPWSKRQEKKSLRPSGVDSMRKPEKVHTDKTTAFVNRRTQQLLKSYKIHWFTTKNVKIKCSNIERFNKPLKTRMWKYFTANDTRKWFDGLDQLMYKCNYSYLRSIIFIHSHSVAQAWWAKYSSHISKFKVWANRLYPNSTSELGRLHVFLHLMHFLFELESRIGSGNQILFELQVGWVVFLFICFLFLACFFRISILHRVW